MVTGAEGRLDTKDLVGHGIYLPHGAMGEHRHGVSELCRRLSDWRCAGGTGGGGVRVWVSLKTDRGTDPYTDGRTDPETKHGVRPPGVRSMMDGPGDRCRTARPPSSHCTGMPRERARLTRGGDPLSARPDRSADRDHVDGPRIRRPCPRPRPGSAGSRWCTPTPVFVCSGERLPRSQKAHKPGGKSHSPAQRPFRSPSWETATSARSPIPALSLIGRRVWPGRSERSRSSARAGSGGGTQAMPCPARRWGSDQAFTPVRS